MGLDRFLGLYGTSSRDLPDIAGEYSGGIIICGDAACVWDDLERFGCRWHNAVYRGDWDFMTVNRLVEVFPGAIDHAYSNSGRVLMRHVEARRDEYVDEFGPPRHTHARTNGTAWEWPWHGDGTSGLWAILTALALGYDRVVLAGMPLTNMHHNGEPPWRVTRFTTEVEDTNPHWQRAIKYAFQGRVKSLSGRTKDWLGDPG